MDIIEDTIFKYEPKYDKDVLPAFYYYSLIAEKYLNDEKEEFSELAEQCIQSANEKDPLFLTVLGYLYYFDLIQDDLLDPFEIALKVFKEAADLDSQEARYAWSRIKMDSNDSLDDYSEGKKELRRLASEGFKKAVYYIALFDMETSDEDTEEFRNSIVSFKILCEEEYVPAFREYGEFLSYSENEEDHKLAFEYLQKSYESGDIDSCVYLGRCYLNGIGTNVTLNKAYRLFTKALEHDNRECLYDLGVILINKYFAQRNPELAFELFTKAYEEEEDTRALFYLGKLKYYGVGTTKDKLKALEYFELALEKEVSDHLSDIYYFIGMCYIDDKLKIYKFHEAFNFFKWGHELGDLDCSIEYAKLLYWSENRYEDAYKIFQEIINSDRTTRGQKVNARFWLVFYEDAYGGLELNMDDKTRCKYILEACEFKIERAYLLGAECLYKGIGCAVDKVKGKEYLTKALEYDMISARDFAYEVGYF